MAEWRSQYCSTDNEYILYRIWVRETATDPIANTSTIRVTVYAWRTNNYTTNYAGGCNIKIDGVARTYQYWDWNEKPIYQDSDTVLYDEQNIVIQHEANGTKSINVQATCEWYNGGQIYIDSPYQGFDISLTGIDRGLAIISASITNVGVNSFTLNAVSNVDCDLWHYSLNGGAWTWYSSVSTTSTSVNITGLSPNTTYNVRMSCRRTYNQVWTETGNIASATTIGNSVLNSVNTITADNSTATITLNATVYVPSYSHRIDIKHNGTIVLTKLGITLANGSNTITLTANERNVLLNHMSSIKSFSAVVDLSTWSGETQIGSTSSKTATVQTTAANSAPTFTGFSYQDNNSSVVSVTGNNQVMVQNASTVKITANAATAKNGASISNYSVAFGNLSTSSASTTITMGTITTSGTVTMTVTAVDSRGYSTSRSVNVTVVPFSGIRFTSYSLRRVNEVENTLQLSFNGVIQNITVGGTDKNSLLACQYRYKKTSDGSYGSYTNITSGVTRSGNNLSYSNNALVSLDANYSWHVQIYLQDKLTTDTITLTVGQGTPLVSFRNKKVGINHRNPSQALDIDGSIGLTGKVTPTYKSGTWVNSLTNSAVIIPDQTGSFGGWICGPTKNGRIAISTYQADNDYLYIGYGERGRTTNSYVRSLRWNGGNGALEANDYYGLLNGYTMNSTSLGTNNTSDTWVPVINGNSIQHRVIPTNYNTAPTSSRDANRVVTRDASGNSAFNKVACTYLNDGNATNFGKTIGVNVVSSRATITNGGYFMYGDKLVIVDVYFVLKVAINNSTAVLSGFPTPGRDNNLSIVGIPSTVPDAPLCWRIVTGSLYANGNRSANIEWHVFGSYIKN